MGLEAKPQLHKMLPSPTVKQTGQKSGSLLCGNFQILIVSAVKICKQRLQTASAFRLRLSDLLRLWTPLWNFRPPDSRATVPQMKIPGAPVLANDSRPS